MGFDTTYTTYWMPVMTLLGWWSLSLLVIWISFRLAPLLQYQVETGLVHFQKFSFMPKWLRQWQANNSARAKACIANDFFNHAPLIEILLSHRTAQLMTQTLNLHLETLVDEVLEQKYGQLWAQLPLLCKQGVYKQVSKQLPFLVDDALDDIRQEYDQKNSHINTLMNPTHQENTVLTKHYWHSGRVFRQTALKNVAISALAWFFVADLMKIPTSLSPVLLSLICCWAVHRSYQHTVHHWSYANLVANQTHLLDRWIQQLSECITDKVLTVNQMLRQSIAEHSAMSYPHAKASAIQLTNTQPPQTKLPSQTKYSTIKHLMNKPKWLEYKQTQKYLSRACSGQAFVSEIRIQITYNLKEQLTQLPMAKRKQLLHTLWKPYSQYTQSLTMLIGGAICFIVLLW